MPAQPSPRPRLLPDRPFPAYAYLPGRHPHPVRHPLGHSYQLDSPDLSEDVELGFEEFLWGIDLFNHGYYWEAHEAWEGLWQAAREAPQNRLLFKGIILLAASGVKVREGKQQAAKRHGTRSAATLRQVVAASNGRFESAIGMPIPRLAELAEATPDVTKFTGATGPVFPFLLGTFQP